MLKAAVLVTFLLVPNLTPAHAASPGVYAIEVIETWVAAPNANQLYTRIVQPVPALYPGRRFPALVAIPGGTGAGAPLANLASYRDLAASGFVLVVFNPEGRGNGLPGNLQSEGVEDCNGFAHQDDLKAVVEYAAALTNVDAANIGVETSSFGIAIGAGAVGRYPNLPVAYLVDQEGPHDNLVITFYDAGHETAVCGHWSTVTDPSPQNLAFWAEREAVRYIGTYPGRYLRMQAEVDHAQNPGYFRHGIEMVGAATRPEFGGTGAAAWTRMNGSDIGNVVNAVYALDQPSQYPTWVPGRLADHPGLSLAYDREMAAVSTLLLSGKKLSVSERSGDPAQRKITVTSADPSIGSVPADHPSAPTVSGGFLEIINSVTGEIDAFSLPAAHWAGNGTPAGSRGYTYKDTGLVAGPCKKIRLTNGRRLQVSCKGAQIGFSLNEPSQGGLGVKLTLGAGNRYCMWFGGMVLADEPSRFRTKDAPAPATCP
jgi:hypothetical protein